jgi:hypothetical protein
MSSRYIPNRGKTHFVQNNWEWSSKGADSSDVVEDSINYEEVKKRIEAKPLEEVTFKDLYTFPFHQAKYGNWVYDADSNFIFQFLFNNEETRSKTISILNDEFKSEKENKFVHEDGTIYFYKDGELKEFILIRGWGNLTGTGGYNLDGEYAGRIQDTLAEYIVEKLTKNK